MQTHHDLRQKTRESPARRDRLQAFLQRWRVTLSFAFAVVTLLLAEPTLRLILIGGSLSLLGAGLRAWAAGHLKKDRALSTGGPYAYTRNPLYLGSFLLGLGVTTASGSLFLLVMFLILFVLLFSSAMSREAPHLRKLFPDDYPSYHRSVPVFFPRLTPYPGAARTRFDVRLYRAHREYRVVLVLLLVFAILLAKVAWGRAQSPSAMAQDAQLTVAPRVSEPLPFPKGETLEYEARFSKLIISGKIGRITFSFAQSSEPPLINDYFIRVTAISEGIWMRIFGIKIEDVFESFVNPEDFGVDRTRKRYSQGRKKWFELSVFDHGSRTVMFIKRDLAKRDAQPKVKNAPTRAWVQDIVAGTYYLRALPLTVGQTIVFPLCDSGKTYDTQVKVIGQERLRTRLGTFDTLKVQPLVFGKGRLVDEKGEVYIWVTDDARHIPVRARVHGGFGTATIDLKSIKQLSD